MKLPRLSIDRIRVSVAILSLLLFVQTLFWLAYDVFELGISDTWSEWANGTNGPFPATSSLDLGLAALQLIAGIAVLRGARGAGGLLVTSSVVTLIVRLPPIWYLVLDSPSDPWFAAPTGPSLTAVGVSAVFSFVVAAALGALLLRVHHLENEQVALSEFSASGIRPMKVTASTSGAVLGVLNVFYIARNTNSLVESENDVWLQRLFGRGSVQSVLGVSQSWQWGTLTVACGVCMYLAIRRRPVAHGFTLGLSLFMLPLSLLSIAGAVSGGTFTHAAFGSVQNVLELLGSGAVLGLVVWEARSVRRTMRMRTAVLPSPAPATGTVDPRADARVPSGEI